MFKTKQIVYNFDRIVQILNMSSPLHSNQKENDVLTSI